MVMARDGTGQRGAVSPRHVWVRFGSMASPGVLLNWRKTRDGQWYAYVMYAAGGGTIDVTVTTQWVPAAHVRPVSGWP
jgi:hypothetical protein